MSAYGFFRAASLTAAPMLCLAAGASAQSFNIADYKQGAFGFLRQGNQQFVGAQVSGTKDMVPFGYIDAPARSFVFRGNGSDINVAPTTSAASGTLSRLLANRAQITDDGSVIAAGINSRSIGQALIPYKPEWAATPGPERLRYQNLFELITSRDGDAWESPVAIEFRSRTGYNKSWQAGASVATGENIVGYEPNPEPYVYRVLQGGTLGSSSPTAGPNSAPFSNGTVQLQWINYSNLAAKISLTNTVIASGNAGQTWANNFNFIMNPLNGSPRFMTNTEFDFANNSGYDCSLFSGRTCNSITMFTGGQNISTSYMSFGALKGTPTFAAEWGISMVGNNVVRDAAIEINTNSKVGIGLGRYSGIIGGAVFAESSIQDQSTATEGLSLQGNYSNAAVHVSGSTPIALSMNAGQKLCFYGGENCFLKDNSQGSLLYQVGGSTVLSFTDGGTANARSYSVNGTAGATCIGPPTGNFRVVNGIVTAC